MKNKIFVYTPYSGSFYDKYLNSLIRELDYNEIIVGSSHTLSIYFPNNTKVIKFDNLEYWSNANDYKELSALFEYLEEVQIYRIHIIRYSYENLFSIINNYPNIEKFKISLGIFGHREIIETRVRQILFDKIVNSSSISSILVHSISKKVVPIELSRYLDNEKVHFVSDPIYDNVEDYKMINSVSEKINLLYFGSFFFGKGVDILLKAINSLRINNYKFTIAGNAQTANFDIKDLELNNSINFINQYLSEGDVIKLFEKNNVIVLPYRSTYTNDTSGVLVQAAIAGRLVIVPDIFPFNEVVKRYSLGLTFEADSSESLKKVIEEIVNNYEVIYTKAKFRSFVENISTWKEMSNLI